LELLGFWIELSSLGDEQLKFCLCHVHDRFLHEFCLGGVTPDMDMAVVESMVLGMDGVVRFGFGCSGVLEVGIFFCRS
jgi:hypothetical protein